MVRKNIYCVITLLIVWALVAWKVSNGEGINAPKLEYKIITTFNKKPCITQGLAWKNKILFESCGGYDSSTLKVIEPLGNSNTIFSKNKYWFEGITISDNRLYLLTWKSRKVFVFNLENYELLEIFNISHEGWGVANSDRELIISDGSSRLTFYDIKSYKKTKEINVSDSVGEVSGLNALSWVNGFIFANIIGKNVVVSISPISGKITGWLDLTQLCESKFGHFKANGIAYINESKSLIVTGKNWEEYYEIKIFNKSSKSKPSIVDS